MLARLPLLAIYVLIIAVSSSIVVGTCSIGIPAEPGYEGCQWRVGWGNDLLSTAATCRLWLVGKEGITDTAVLVGCCLEIFPALGRHVAVATKRRCRRGTNISQAMSLVMAVTSPLKT